MHASVRICVRLCVLKCGYVRVCARAWAVVTGMLATQVFMPASHGPRHHLSVSPLTFAATGPDAAAAEAAHDDLEQTVVFIEEADERSEVRAWV
jgi:hypothetical protein